MISALLFFVVFLLVCYPYGWGMIRGLQRWVLNKREGLPGFTWTILVGLLTVTTLASFLTFFMPVSWLAFFLVLTGAGFIAVVGWRTERQGFFPHIQFHKTIWIYPLALLVVFSILENVTDLPTNPDTGLYHAQMIRWIETYPVVPGLGNLHDRFAFNSSWLLSNAFFSLSFLRLQSFHLLPGALFTIVMFEFLSGAAAWLKGNSSLGNILRTLLLPVAFYTLASELSSPGTDLPVNLMIWMLALLWLDSHVKENFPRCTANLIAIIYPLYMLTIKLSVAPFLVFSLLGLWELRKECRFKSLFSIVLAGCLIGGPWLARNLILSGYLVFPQTSLDWFHFDWKIPRSSVEAAQRGITGWARIPREEIEVSSSMSVRKWAPIWFANLTRNRQLVFCLALVSPLLLAVEMGIYRLWKKANPVRFVELAQVMEISLLALVFWFFSAPDFRFGYGTLMLLITGVALLPLQFIQHILAHDIKRKTLLPAALLLMLVVYQAGFLVRSASPQTWSQRLIVPVDYRVLPTSPCELENTTILSADSYMECWYAPFPRVPYCPSEVELRGKDLRDGFRVRE